MTQPVFTDEEAWRAVVGYEGLYEVSSHGRVRSLDKTVAVNGGMRTRPGHIRKLSLLPTGYIELALTKDRAHKHHFVHALVLAAFVGPRPDGFEGCHNDGNAQNNHFKNLRWDTKKANQADRLRHGTASRGKTIRRTYLSNEQAQAVKTDPRSRDEIAADYGICAATVTRFKSGKPRMDRW